jgi:two-component system chemotaxis response regulator CheY
MKALFTDAGLELASVVFSISRDPPSWAGWHALHIRQTGQGDEEKTRLAAILKSCFSHTEGNIFFCSPQDTYVVGKAMARTDLTLVLYQIERLGGEYTIYDLGINPLTFYRDYVARVESANHYSLPVLEKPDPNLSWSFDESNPPPSIFDSTMPRVLLVEDDPATRWMVRNVLKDKCWLATADATHKVFDMVRTYRPDIIFLDIGLPDGSGHDVLRWIMKNDRGVAVVMFSGQDSVDNIASALEDGARGFIAKPFTSDRLFHYIDSLRPGINGQTAAVPRTGRVV